MMSNKVDVDELASEYKSGRTLEWIARRHGLSFGTVRSRLLDRGVRLRPPGRRPLAATRIRSRPS